MASVYVCIYPGLGGAHRDGKTARGKSIREALAIYTRDIKRYILDALAVI